MTGVSDKRPVNAICKLQSEYLSYCFHDCFMWPLLQVQPKLWLAEQTTKPFKGVVWMRPHHTDCYFDLWHVYGQSGRNGQVDSVYTSETFPRRGKYLQVAKCWLNISITETWLKVMSSRRLFHVDFPTNLLCSIMIYPICATRSILFSFWFDQRNNSRRRGKIMKMLIIFSFIQPLSLHPN
jgi:hypothetical protein